MILAHLSQPTSARISPRITSPCTISAKITSAHLPQLALGHIAIALGHTPIATHPLPWVTHPLPHIHCLGSHAPCLGSHTHNLPWVTHPAVHSTSPGVHPQDVFKAKVLTQPSINDLRATQCDDETESRLEGHPCLSLALCAQQETRLLLKHERPVAVRGENKNCCAGSENPTLL
jgi:hypothetical protein